MAKYRTYALSWGPICINFHRWDRRMLRWWSCGSGWVAFFGLGSVAWWSHSRGWPRVNVIQPTALSKDTPDV